MNKNMQALRKLPARGVIITKPDRNSGVVVMKKYEYIQKMSVVLNNSSQFRRHENADDVTVRIPNTPSLRIASAV